MVGLEAKRREAAAKQEQERRYVEECKKVSKTLARQLCLGTATAL